MGSGNRLAVYERGAIPTLCVRAHAHGEACRLYCMQQVMFITNYNISSSSVRSVCNRRLQSKARRAIRWLCCRGLCQLSVGRHQPENPNEPWLNNRDFHRIGLWQAGCRWFKDIRHLRGCSRIYQHGDPHLHYRNAACGCHRVHNLGAVALPFPFDPPPSCFSHISRFS